MPKYIIREDGKYIIPDYIINVIRYDVKNDVKNVILDYIIDVIKDDVKICRQ